MCRPVCVLVLQCIWWLVAVTPSVSSSAETAPSQLSPPQSSIPAVHIEPASMLRHVEVLASDEFEGRKPGTNGEVLTVEYLIAAFKRFGLQPGNPDGSYSQAVSLIGITSELKARVMAGGEEVEWLFRRDFAGHSAKTSRATRIENSDLVFVGYGVVAPEYGWDDYRNVDVRGKTVVVLTNDPQVADPTDPARLDPAVFKGNVRTSYATGRHKSEVAVARGAVARITIHDTELGYPFAVALAQSGREQLHLKEDTEPQLQADLSISVDSARDLFRRAGLDLDALQARAHTKDFKAVPLAAQMSIDVTSSIREVRSQNVIARSVGQHPKLKDEVIIYTAHWDHLGRDSNRSGDQIYNGALDNASGVAALLEIARSYAALDRPTARSVVFIATTSEESGLLGAKHYVAHPLYPLQQTVANLNLDVIGAWGRTRDFQVTGWGESDLDRLLIEIAAGQGKLAVADQTPLLGAYYRQDGFEFARAGVPSVYLRRGVDFIDMAPGVGEAKVRAYIANDYHQVTDAVRPDFDFSGGAELAEFAFAVGHRLAQGGPFPQWLAGTEFKAKRDAMTRAPR